MQDDIVKDNFLQQPYASSRFPKPMPSDIGFSQNFGDAQRHHFYRPPRNPHSSQSSFPRSDLTASRILRPWQTLSTQQPSSIQSSDTIPRREYLVPPHRFVTPTTNFQDSHPLRNQVRPLRQPTYPPPKQLPRQGSVKPPTSAFSPSSINQYTKDNPFSENQSQFSQERSSISETSNSFDLPEQQHLFDKSRLGHILNPPPNVPHLTRDLHHPPQGTSNPTQGMLKHGSGILHLTRGIPHPPQRVPHSTQGILHPPHSMRHTIQRVPAPPRGMSNAPPGIPPPGVSNPALDMSNPPLGISNPPPGISSQPPGTSNPALDMSNPPRDMSNPPPSMSNPPLGMSNPPLGMSNPPRDMSNPPPSMSNPPLGMFNPPPGTSNPPPGMSNPPPSMSNPPRGMSNPPPGMSNPSSGMSNPPPGIPNQPHNVPHPQQRMLQPPRESFHPTSYHQYQPPPHQPSSHFTDSLPIKNSDASQTTNCGASSLTNDDEAWVASFTRDVCRAKRSDVKGAKRSDVKEAKKSITISEYREKLRECLSVRAEMQETIELIRTTSNEEQLSVIYNRARDLTADLRRLTAVISDPENKNGVQHRVKQRERKRARLKRKKLEKYEEKLCSSEKREEKHKLIDGHLEEIVEAQLTVKRDLEMKAHADTIQCEVRKKLMDTDRMTELLKAVRKLRKVRLDSVVSRGIKANMELHEQCESTISHLLVVLEKQRSIYVAESKTLEVMLGLEQAESKEKEAEHSKRVDAEMYAKAYNKLYTQIFGRHEECSPAMLPYLQYYTQAETSLPCLTAIRNDWDRYLVDASAPYASRIPDGWVLPAPPSHKQWAVYSNDS